MGLWKQEKERYSIRPWELGVEWFEDKVMSSLIFKTVM